MTRRRCTTRLDMAPKWRPDGGAIAFGQDEPAGVHLEIADAATGFRVRPLDALLCPAGGPTWSPDGRLISVISPADGVHCVRGEDLVVLDAQTGNTISQTPVAPIAYSAGWSADRRYRARPAYFQGSHTVLRSSLPRRQPASRERSRIARLSGGHRSARTSPLRATGGS